MAKKRKVILIFLMLVILAFMIFVSVGAESEFGDFVFSNPFVPALLFFVFFGAVAGVLKIFVDFALPNRISSDPSKAWEKTRTKGKLNYILTALMVAGLPLTVVLTLQLANSDGSAYVLRNFVVLLVVLLGGVTAIAASLWNHRESIYLKAKEQESPSAEVAQKPRQA